MGTDRPGPEADLRRRRNSSVGGSIMAKNRMSSKSYDYFIETGIRPAQSVKINEQLATQIYKYISKDDSNFQGFGEFVRYCVARYLEDKK